MSIGINTTYGIGTTDRVASSYLTCSTQVTIAFKYFLPSANTALARYFSQQIGATSRRDIWFSSSNTFTFAQSWSGAGNIQWAFPTGAIGAYNTWHSAVFTYDGSLTTNDPALYVDGTKHAPTNNPTPVGTMSSNIDASTNFGNRVDGIRPINGIIQDMAIWERVLTDSECYAISNFVSPKLHMNNLKLYIPGIRDANSYVLNTTTTLTGTRFNNHGRTIGI